LPKFFDSSSTFYAYIYSSINREDELAELQKGVEGSLLGQNIYTKEIAGQALNIGHHFKNMVGNIYNVQKASSIDVNKLQEHLNKNE